MRRLFWVVMGATAGVLIVRQVSKAARSVTPEGAAEKAGSAVNNLADASREFKDDVKAGMAERDNELRDALGIAGHPDDQTGEPARAGEPVLPMVEYLLTTREPRQRL